MTATAKQILTGSIAGLLGGLIGFVMLYVFKGSFFPIVKPAAQVQYTYSSFRIDGDKLNTLYNGDFSKMYLYFEFNGNIVNVQARVLATNSSDAQVPDGFLQILKKGKTLVGDRIMEGDSFYLEHYDINKTVQLKILDSIMEKNKGGYLDFNADEYAKIEPSCPVNKYIYYQITPYNSKRDPINIKNVSPQVFRFNPSPPATPYKL